MQLAELWNGPPIVGDGAFETGGYDYAALGYDAQQPFSNMSSVYSDAMPFEALARVGNGAEVSGRISAAMLALLVIGVVGFYVWTHNFQS